MNNKRESLIQENREQDKLLRVYRSVSPYLIESLENALLDFDNSINELKHDKGNPVFKLLHSRQKELKMVLEIIQEDNDNYG